MVYIRDGKEVLSGIIEQFPCKLSAWGAGVIACFLIFHKHKD
jgi:hypothetical protein